MWRGLQAFAKMFKTPACRKNCHCQKMWPRFTGVSHFPERMQRGVLLGKNLVKDRGDQEWLRIDVTMKALIPLLASPSVLSEFTSSSALPVGLSLQASVGRKTVAF